MKKILSFALALVLVLTAFPATVSAEIAPEDEGLYAYYGEMLNTPNIVEGKIVVSFKDGVNDDDAYDILYAVYVEVWRVDADYMIEPMIDFRPETNGHILQITYADVLDAMVILAKNESVESVYPLPEPVLTDDEWRAKFEPMMDGVDRIEGEIVVGFEDDFVTAEDMYNVLFDALVYAYGRDDVEFIESMMDFDERFNTQCITVEDSKVVDTMIYLAKCEEVQTVEPNFTVYPDTDPYEKYYDQLDDIDRIEGEIVVGFPEGTDPDGMYNVLYNTVADAYGTEDESVILPNVGYHEGFTVHTVTVPDEIIVNVLITLLNNPLVQAAEFNYRLYPDYLPGDANFDDNLTAEDYVIVKRVVLGTLDKNAEGLFPRAMDANDDGEINAQDYVLVKRFVLNFG